MMKDIYEADQVFLNHSFNDINSKCNTICHNPFLRIKHLAYVA